MSKNIWKRISSLTAHYSLLSILLTQPKTQKNFVDHKNKQENILDSFLQNASLAHQWDCMGFQEEDEKPRPEFAANAPYLEENPITGVIHIIEYPIVDILGS